MRKVDSQALYDADLQTWFRRKDPSADDHIFVVGITDWTQGYFKGITAVYFNCKVSEKVMARSAFVTIESDKATSDIELPVDCKVLNINNEMISSPHVIHDDCYGVGWLIEVEVLDISQLSILQNAEWYDNAVGSFFRKGD